MGTFFDPQPFGKNAKPNWKQWNPASYRTPASFPGFPFKRWTYFWLPLSTLWFPSKIPAAKQHTCSMCGGLLLSLGQESSLQKQSTKKSTSPPPSLKKKRELDHGWPESRTSQARSAQRCRMRSFSLHFVKQARDSTRQRALRKLVGASWSAQVALRKLHCASCSAQVAPRKLLRQVGPCKLLCANCAPCKLLCAEQVAQSNLRRPTCTDQFAQSALPRATCAEQLNYAEQLAQSNLHRAARKLLSASCCKMQVASCDARPRTREESNPRPAGSGSRRANHETTPEDQFEQQKSQKTMGFCTSTTPIPAEGCASIAEIAKNHGFLHLDHADPRRGSREQVRNRKKKHGFLHLDHADSRRGLREHRRNRKKPWVFAPRPRRSPQRVARAG